MASKVLFVINSFLAGGAERSLIELLPRLQDRGIEPMVVALRHRDVGFEDEAQSYDFEVRFLEPGGWLSRVRQLRKLIQATEPDLVYTALFDADIAGRVAAIGSGVPLLTNLANTSYDPVRQTDPNVRPGRLRLVQVVDGWTARHLTTHFHAISEAVKDSVVTHLRVDPSRVSVVLRGRDEDRLGEPGEDRAGKVRSKLGIPPTARVLLTVGRQEFQKGHTHLLHAFAGIVAVHPDSHLLIAGRTGHMSSSLATLTDELGLTGSVEFLGHRTDIPDLLCAADLFVFPSLYEGLGGALIEATAMGLPIVASDLPALREVVDEGVNALLVPAGDEEQLEHAIDQLLRDPSRMRSFAKHSRNIFLERFRLDPLASDLAELLQRVAAQGRM